MNIRGDEPCIGKIDLFYPDRTKLTRARAAITAAKALCASCDRADECLAGARARHEPDGIWGGVDFFRPSHGPGYRRPAPPTAAEQRAAVAWLAAAADNDGLAPIQHGTQAGYSAHWRRKDLPACPDCAAAHTRYRHDHKQRNKAGR